MKIEVLFPEFGNLFGDNSNISYLRKCLPDAEIIETSINSRPTFVDEEVNLIYLGPMSERAQEIVIEKLRPYKEKIEELISNNTTFLWIGNSVEILGKYIENEDGSKVEALGIFDIFAKRDMMNRKNSNVIGKYEDIEIVGFQSQFTTLYADNKENYFLELSVGMGTYENPKLEGIKKNNFIGTYVIGPILILNPLFTMKLLKMMGVEEPNLALEKEVMTAYEVRLQEFNKKFKEEQ